MVNGGRSSKNSFARRSAKLVVAAALFVVATAPFAPSAGAATSNVSARWEMNEARGSRVLTDSSANRLNGTIGTSVQAGTAYGGSTGHRFPSVSPNSSPVNPQRLDTVPHNYRLDPEAYNFAIDVRLRTTAPAGNVVQKGQATEAGGFYKVDIEDGRVACTFVGASGAASAKSETTITDGQWHSIRCERSGATVILSIDGVIADRRTGVTGRIANTAAVSIGGKSSCNQVSVGCDYFSGDIDRIAMSSNRGVVK